MFVGFWKIKNKTRQVGVLWFCPRLFKPTGTGLIIISSFFKIPFNLSFCDVVILAHGFCILDTPLMATGEGSYHMSFMLPIGRRVIVFGLFSGSPSPLASRKAVGVPSLPFFQVLGPVWLDKAFWLRITVQPARIWLP